MQLDLLGIMVIGEVEASVMESAGTRLEKTSCRSHVQLQKLLSNQQPL